MRKITKNLLVLSTLTMAVAAPIATTVSCGKKEAKVYFINYEDYMDESLIEEINAKVPYTTFGDLPEIEDYIKSNKLAGAVGSDYFNATLAAKGLIKPIDFKRAFGFTATDVDTIAELETKLQTIYSAEAWKLMSSFDSFFADPNGDGDQSDKIDAFGPSGEKDNVADKLWQYNIPYFMQNKVIAVNPWKAAQVSGADSALVTSLKEAETQEEIDALFTDKTYKGILAQLKTAGFNKLTVNDYMRDNLMIGSETTGATPTISGAITTEANATKYATDFGTTINPWAKADRKFLTSGVDTLQTLLSKENNSHAGPDFNANVALMYNGDALFAHYGGDVEGAAEGKIRIINPTNTTFLMDGIVITNNLPADIEEKMYSIIKDILVKGHNKLATADNYEDDNNLFTNFDFVNYTPAYKELLSYVETNYFEADATANPAVDADPVGKAILMSTKDNGSKANVNVTKPITDGIFSTAKTEYDKLK